MYSGTVVHDSWKKNWKCWNFRSLWLAGIVGSYYFPWDTLWVLCFMISHQIFICLISADGTVLIQLPWYVDSIA